MWHGEELEIKFRKEEHRAVLEYLLNRSKIQSLNELSAHAVASLLPCDVDVNQLELPLVLHPWVAGFLQTSPSRFIDRDEDDETESDDSSASSDDLGQDDDLLSNSSLNDLGLEDEAVDHDLTNMDVDAVPEASKAPDYDEQVVSCAYTHLNLPRWGWRKN